MEKITEKLNVVLSLNKKVGHDFVVSGNYKTEREWLVLGHMALHLEKHTFNYPVFADKTDPPKPDFMTYDKSKKRFKPVEICEVLTPGRKRGDEYRDNKKKPYNLVFVEPVNQPWSSFISVLNKKFKKRYEENDCTLKDCWLVVYHDMNYCEITNFGCWHDLILANAELWNGKDNQCSLNLNNSPFEKIFVLNSSFKAMVEIYPSISVITPE